VWYPNGSTAGARVYRSIFLFDLPEGLTEIISATVEFEQTYYLPPNNLPGQPDDVPVLVSQADLDPQENNPRTIFTGRDRGADWEWQLEGIKQLPIPLDAVNWGQDWLSLHTRSGIEARPDLWGDGVYVHNFSWEPDRVPILTIWARGE
jgi:hypothetical protein